MKSQVRVSNAFRRFAITDANRAVGGTPPARRVEVRMAVEGEYRICAYHRSSTEFLLASISVK